AVDDLSVDYARPQETGHRPGLRALMLAAPDGTGLEVRTHTGFGGAGGTVPAVRPGFTASRHTSQELSAARHPHELPPSEHVHRYLDAAQQGIGSGACGPGALPEHQLWPGAYAFAVTLRAVTAGG